MEKLDFCSRTALMKRFLSQSNAFKPWDTVARCMLISKDVIFEESDSPALCSFQPLTTASIFTGVKDNIGSAPFSTGS